MLSQYGITGLVDVRSVPYSRFWPHFNREPIKAELARNNIKYTYRGGSLGGRPSDSGYYDENGRVCYKTVAEAQWFKQEVLQLIDDAARHRLVLMCSEEDPLKCHRTLLIAHELTKQGLDVKHIRANGRLVPKATIDRHEAVIDRLIDQHNLNQGKFRFSDDGCSSDPPQGQYLEQDLVEEAIEKQRQAIAFVKD